MMVNPKTPAQRLRFARERAGYRTAKSFAEHHDIPQSTYALHETGQRKLRPDIAAIYAAALDCSPAWLLTGEGNAPDFQTVLPSRGLSILELDVRAAAGDGAMIDDTETAEVADIWQLPGEFVRAQTTAPADKLRVIRVYGDSMEPVFHAGDRVLVDLSDRTPSPPGVFVVWDGLGVVIKRLEFLPYSDPPAIRLLSANPAYGAYERPLADVAINGRVIAKWLWT